MPLSDSCLIYLTARPAGFGKVVTGFGEKGSAQYRTKTEE